MVRFVIQVALLLIVTAFAWRGGNRAERQISAIYCGLVGIGAVYGALAGMAEHPNALPTYRILLDVLTFAAVLFVALKSDRWWVLWVASAQLLAVLAHILRLTVEMHTPIAYAVMERWPVWLAILLTGYGTARTIGARSAVRGDA